MTPEEQFYRVPQGALSPSKRYKLSGLTADCQTVSLTCLDCAHVYPHHADNCDELREDNHRRFGLLLKAAEKLKARAEAAEDALARKSAELVNAEQYAHDFTKAAADRADAAEQEVYSLRDALARLQGLAGELAAASAREITELRRRLKAAAPRREGTPEGRPEDEETKDKVTRGDGL